MILSVFEVNVNTFFYLINNGRNNITKICNSKMVFILFTKYRIFRLVKKTKNLRLFQ